MDIKAARVGHTDADGVSGGDVTDGPGSRVRTRWSSSLVRTTEGSDNMNQRRRLHA